MPDFRDLLPSLRGLGTLSAPALSTVSGNAVTVAIGGTQVVVRAAAGVTCAVGDILMITRMGSTYWAVAVLTAAPALPPPPPVVIDPPPAGDSSPAPKPVVTTGVLTCAPVTTATFRDGSWRSDIGSTNSADTYQGRYSGSSFGRNTGCAFYGSKPRTIAGATVTNATIHVRRETGSGDYAARTATLRLVSQSTRPGGAPTLNETTSGPSLAVGSTNNAFAIPTSWAQAMVNGTRGGLAINISSDSPYIRLAGLSSWSAAWVLTISWRRG